MAKSNFFLQGTTAEQGIVSDLILEAISIYGYDTYYVPRTLVGKDDIFGEDRFSVFKKAYPIEMYLESVDGFGGNGAFISQFGLQIEESATFVVSKRRWEQLIQRDQTTILPGRPCEGDLIYFPLSNSLFEIKFVDHQNPFYQLGNLYVYKLKVELFQYNSEELRTGVEEIDDFETFKSLDTEFLSDEGSEDQKLNTDGNKKNQAITEAADEILWDESNPFANIE